MTNIHPVLQSRVNYEVRINNASLSDLVLLFPSEDQHTLQLAMRKADPHMFVVSQEDDQASGTYKDFM